METDMPLNPEKIIQLRESHGWSQEQLAGAAGLSVRTVQRAERDGVASRETKLCLAAALGVSHSDLEARSSERPPPVFSPDASLMAFIHVTLGTTFMMVGAGLAGASLFGEAHFVPLYLGSFFALCGALELALARRWRRKAGAFASAAG